MNNGSAAPPAADAQPCGAWPVVGEPARRILLVAVTGQGPTRAAALEDAYTQAGLDRLSLVRADRLVAPDDATVEVCDAIAVGQVPAGTPVLAWQVLAYATERGAVAVAGAAWSHEGDRPLVGAAGDALGHVHEQLRATARPLEPPFTWGAPPAPPGLSADEAASYLTVLARRRDWPTCALVVAITVPPASRASQRVSAEPALTARASGDVVLEVDLPRLGVEAVAVP